MLAYRANRWYTAMAVSRGDWLAKQLADPFLLLASIWRLTRDNSTTTPTRSHFTLNSSMQNKSIDKTARFYLYSISLFSFKYDDHKKKTTRERFFFPVLDGSPSSLQSAHKKSIHRWSRRREESREGKKKISFIRTNGSIYRFPPFFSVGRKNNKNRWLKDNNRLSNDVRWASQWHTKTDTGSRQRCTSGSQIKVLSHTHFCNSSSPPRPPSS